MPQLSFDRFYRYAELTAILPKGRYSHTCDAVDFKGQKGKRVLILGGRQSAFEWAALLNDEGAAEVHLSHRHESPKFTASDWSWISCWPRVPIN